MKKPVHRLSALFGLWVWLACGIGSAGVFTWNGSVSSDWFTADNWTPAGVPGPADTVNVTNGAINLTGAVAIQGLFNWSGGSLGGDPLTIANGGVLNITGGVILENVLTNAGTVVMTGTGNLTLYNNASTYLGGIYNLAGALWDFQTNANILCACYGHEFFSNAGVLRKSQGSASSGIQVSFTNAGGVVSNLSGTLNFNNGGALNGAYNTAAGAVIDFESGSFTMGVPPVISGAGLCEFTGTTLALAQDVAANLVLVAGTVVLGPGFQNGGNITNLTLSGATLSGTNLVAGVFNWSGGTVNSPLTVASGGVLNIAGGVILENVLTNLGTIVMTGTGNLTVYNNASTYQGGVYNLAGALWDFQTNANILCACYGHEFFSNAGVLRKSQGSASSSIQVSFTNAGTVTNLSGTLIFAGGGILNGAYNTAAGAVVNFEAGGFTMGVPPVLGGAGLYEFTGTTLMLSQDVASNLVLVAGTVVLGPGFQNAGGITNLTLSGATLSGTNLVAGAFNWSGGTINSPLTVASGGVLNITGGVILENVLTNLGTVAMTGTGNLTVYNNTSTYQGGIYNLAGALWDIQTNANILCACYGHEFFSNAGVLRKSQGSASSGIQVSFTNAGGVVTNLSGTLIFTGGGILNGAYDTAAGAMVNFGAGSFTMGVPPVLGGTGLYEFTGTTLTLAQDVASNLVLVAGTVVLGPGFQNAGNITNLTLSGATLSGANLVAGAFTWNGGAIDTPLTVASGGVLNITGGVILENVLTNAGTVVMTGSGNITLYNNNSTYQGGVYNLAGALWDIQTNANILCACYGHEFFSNAGVLRKSQGLGQSVVQVSLTNTGTVDAEAGIFNLGTGFTNASGTLAFGVSGLNSFGQMNIPGNAALDGTASLAWLGGFTPAAGNSFALLGYGSHGGTFANLSLPPGAMGEGNYGATVFSVLITGINTQPSLSIQLANPNTAIVFWPASAVNFGLQTSASLSPGSWSDVLSGIALAGTNQVFTNTVNGKAAFFRLRSR